MADTHSKNYDKVKSYYERGLWDLSRVYRVVGKWITADEHKEITGKDYTVESEA